MSKTIYVYDVEPVVSAVKNSKLPDNLEQDFVEVIDYLAKMDEVNRKKDYVLEDRILYLESYVYDKSSHIVNLCFVSAKYNARRNVIDTDTMTDKGILKNMKDGDKERNHLAIQFYDNNKPLCLFEYNYYGIGYKKIVSYLNEHIKEYHKQKDQDIRYMIKSKNVVSKDFLNALKKMNKISAITLTIDREDLRVSDAKALSGRNELSDEANIVLKPVKGSIFHNTVEDFFYMYNDKSKKIKRVTVEGDAEAKKHLSFDTEAMKERHYVDVAINSITGEVDTEDMYKCFSNILEEV